MNFKNNSKGITLIALVVTIIVLLILAGVSLNLVAGGDGILSIATNAVKETNEAKITEEIELAMAELKSEYYEARYVNRSTTKEFADYAEEKLTATDAEGKLVGIATSSGKITLDGTTISFTETGKTEPTATGTFNKENGSATISGITIEGAGGSANKVIIPEGLAVGSTVSYTPSGTYDEWTTAHSGYSTSYKLASGSLYNAEDTSLTDMTISSWKVFKIDEATGEVQLVPSVPTAATVGLSGANGYNNAVKLLNDACSSLYSNEVKGITARSIKIEDIEAEDVLDYDPTTYQDTKVNVYYGKAKTDAYDTNKQYPAIYAQEIDSVITPAPEGKTKTLGVSDAASDWVTGSVTAGTSIQPYQTYYQLSNSDFSSKLNEGYSNVLLPSGTSTNYWVASRCVNLHSGNCSFSVHCVSSGYLNGGYAFDSDGTPDYFVRPLFPVVSLNASIIQGDTTSGWSIQ